MDQEKERHSEYQYLNLLEDTMQNGVIKHDYATGKELRSVFGRQIRFDLSQGFPLLTTKQMAYKSMIHELVWFLRGDTNIKYLVDNNVKFWDDWAYKPYNKAADKGLVPKLTIDEFRFKIKGLPKEDPFVEKWGELGPVYGRQWRKWHASDGRTIDQLTWALDKVKNEPDRKHICVSAWNPEYIYEMSLPGTEMAIPPCHTLYQFNVANNKLSLQLYQRSSDEFLGVPVNIASYALLNIIAAQLTEREIGDFVNTFGDAHIYSDHYDQVREQLTRKPYPLPKVRINPQRNRVEDLDKLVFDDIEIEEYNYHPRLKGDITVVGGFDEKNRGKYTNSL